MSGENDNKEHRKQVIAEILRDLHDGKDFEEARKKFAETFDGVAASEISAAEAALIAEGVPVAEVQRLCDVHAALFTDALEEARAALTAEDPISVPGHPLHTLKLENRAIEELIENRARPALADYVAKGDGVSRSALLSAMNELAQIKLHYQRKEELIFPHMERHDITAPPKVMWGVDDEIRAGIAAVIGLASDENADPRKVEEAAKEAFAKINDMISKEENIMFPMIL